MHWRRRASRREPIRRGANQLSRHTEKGKTDMGKMIELTAADGHKLDAYRADPIGKARGGVVVIEEIFGVNDHIKEVVDGYAADGYLAIAPAMFDRTQKNVDLPYTQEGIVKGRELIAKTALDTAMLDAGAAVNVAAAAGKVGIVGYCWGGLVAWIASAKLSGLACAVPYYGGGIVNHADIEPRVPVLAHFADRDSMIPLEGVKQLQARHDRQQIFIYAADHGFNCDHRPAFDAVAAKQARERTLAFLRLHVG
jgi:carboxymethylenebutenolidase